MKALGNRTGRDKIRQHHVLRRKGTVTLSNITITENSSDNFDELPPLTVLMRDGRWKKNIILQYFCIQKRKFCAMNIVS